MAKTRRHEIEGAVLDVPLRYDQRTGRELEEYPDLQAHPVYTPAGERIMLTVEDACPHGRTGAGASTAAPADTTDRPPTPWWACAATGPSAGAADGPHNRRTDGDGRSPVSGMGSPSRAGETGRDTRTHSKGGTP